MPTNQKLAKFIGFFIIWMVAWYVMQLVVNRIVSTHNTTTTTVTGSADTGSVLTGSSLTGLIGTGAIFPIQTGSTVSGEKTLNVLTFVPKNQPFLTGSYQANTDALNSYLSDGGTFQFVTPGILKGRLRITMYKDPKPKSVFLVFYDSRINGYMMTGYLPDDTKNISYGLDQIPIYRYSDGSKFVFDWLNTTLIKPGVHFIGGYSTEKGNGIQKIEITWN